MTSKHVSPLKTRLGFYAVYFYHSSVFFLSSSIFLVEGFRVFIVEAGLKGFEDDLSSKTSFPSYGRDFIVNLGGAGFLLHE